MEKLHNALVYREEQLEKIKEKIREHVSAFWVFYLGFRIKKLMHFFVCLKKEKHANEVREKAKNQSPNSSSCAEKCE